LKTTDTVLMRQLEIYTDKAAFDSNTLAEKYDRNKLNLEYNPILFQIETKRKLKLFITTEIL